MSGVSAVADVLQNRCQHCDFIKKRPQHRCLPMKFTKSLITPFFTEHLYSDDLPKEMIHLNGTSKVSVSR